MIDWTRGHGPTSSELAVPQLSSFLHSTTTGFGLFLVLVWPLTLPGIWPLQPWFKARYSSFFLSGFFTPYNHPSLDKRITFLLSFVISTESHWLWMVFTVLQVENVKHTGPTKLVLYFTGATNILYTFGGHAVTVWVIFPFLNSISLIFYAFISSFFISIFVWTKIAKKKKRKENRKCCSFFLPFLGLDRKIIKSNFSDPFQGRLN